jgi:hypothetical protein
MGAFMRFENWPSLLADFLADEKPFAWGSRDCCLFAADAVLCITGTDPAKGYRGRYKTAIGAARLQKLYGGLAGLVEKVGLEEITPLKAQRGDVVLIDTPLGEALGVIDLRGDVSAQGMEGITRYPVISARRAWRVI